MFILKSRSGNCSLSPHFFSKVFDVYAAFGLFCGFGGICGKQNQAEHAYHWLETGLADKCLSVVCEVLKALCCLAIFMYQAESVSARRWIPNPSVIRWCGDIILMGSGDIPTGQMNCEALRDSRWCARPNEGFVEQLRILEQKGAWCPVAQCSPLIIWLSAWFWKNTTHCCVFFHHSFFCFFWLN